MKKYIIVVLLAIAGLTSRASAYTIIASSNGQVPAWPSMPIQFWINQNGSPQISNGSEFLAVQSAFQTWQNVSIASVSFQYLGTTPVATVGQDGMNVVTFVDDSVPLGSETVASTFAFLNIDATGFLTVEEADIALSTSIGFSTSGEPGKYDIQSVVTHEAGHLLGLDHSALLSSVMAPYSAVGQLDQRTLSYDDMAGLAWLYPSATALTSLGSIAGTITLSGTGVYGAHVVALDVNGSPVASTISNGDGTYEIDFLAAGAYRLYAEPLDGPVTEQSIGGTSTSFYTGLTTAFSTTYSGNGSDLTKATSSQVFAGRLTSRTNIQVLAASPLNLTEPGTYATHIPAGGQGTLTLGGTSLTSGDLFSASAAAITLGTPVYGGSIGSDAPSSAQIPITIPSTAAIGPKNIAVTVNGTASVLSGGLVVTSPQPGNIQVAPAKGSVDGGITVSITGQNFRAGAQVYLGGLPASNVQVASASTIQAVVPANSAGSWNVVVINSDGTWGVQPAAFTYTALPPQIASIAPLSGPPATIVTILGSEFSSRISNINVQFNGTPANVVSASRTQIQALVPYNATTGPVTVSVLGQTATGPAFTVSAAASTNLARPGATFVDAISGGSPLTFTDTDDAAALVSLPFTFTLFDKSYAAGAPIAVTTNGWISLDAYTRPEYQNGALPGAGSNPPALIAPFFDDLFMTSASAVTVRTSGADPNQQLAIEWSNFGIHDEQLNDTGASVTFEAILYQSSNDIQFIYKSLSGPRSDGASATVGMQNSARTQAVQSGFNQSLLSNGLVITYHFINGLYGAPAAAPGVSSKTFSMTNQGGASIITDGLSANLTVGYATIQPDASKTSPAGVAIFGYRQAGTLVTEAGVPASPLIQSGRIYAEVGAVVDTGLAIANPGDRTATISFYFTDSAGTNIGSNTTTIPPHNKIAGFLDQKPFNSGNIQGTFTFSSDQSVAAVALRGFTNERSDFLISTLPVIDMSAGSAAGTAVLPHFADGGGWRTQVILVNPTDSPMSGNIQFVSAAGAPLNSAPFSIPPRTSFKQVTAGTGSSTQSGSVQIAPAVGSGTPASFAIFSLRPSTVTVSEAAASPSTGTALRMYVEASGVPGAIGSIQSGFALANTGSTQAAVTFDLTDLNGQSLGSASMNLSANAQTAKFLSDIFPSLTLPLKGVLRVSTTNGAVVSAVGLRGRYNERNDFLITTTPPTNETAAASTSPLYFPHIANGGGYTTQFILFSGARGQSTSGAIDFFNQDSTAMSLSVN